MVCHNCQMKAKKHGKDRKGHQRYRCNTCSKTFQEPTERTIDDSYLSEDRIVGVLQLLTEGCSLRTTQRVTGVNLRTIIKILKRAGERCERLLEDRIQSVAVRDVQCDELWGFVGCKEKTKRRLGKTGEQLGDAYCFVGLERHTKVVLAWHLGRRTRPDTQIFTEKLRQAIDGEFQITTDGFAAYPDAIGQSFGHRIDFAQLIKIYKAPREAEQRYSPSEIAEVVPVVRSGNPDERRICTSHVERVNLSMRMQLRRLTRLTNAFSKKWENLKAALALFFAWYNFCWVHSSLRVTPAMEQGITDHIWTLAELLTA